MLDDAVAGAESGAPWWRAAGQCVVCRCWACLMLCGDCSTQFAAPVPRFAHCGEHTGSATVASGACLASPPHFDACGVACDYGLACARLIGEFKFGSHAELATALVGLMLRALRASQVERPDGVKPVLLAPRRLAERGFNEAWELARRAARGLDCPARVEALQHPLEGGHQAELKLGQHLASARSAFIVAPAQRSRVQEQWLAPFGDMMTRSTVLRGAAASLRRAGANRIGAWLLERMPSPTAAG